MVNFYNTNPGQVYAGIVINNIEALQENNTNPLTYTIRVNSTAFGGVTGSEIIDAKVL